MIRINLLPHRAEKRKAKQIQFIVLSVISLVLGAVVVGFVHVAISTQISYQERRNAYLNQEIAVLDKQIDEIKKLKEQTEALLARKQIIESLQANRAETVYLFNELAKQVPAGIYLRSVKQSGSRVALNGYTQSSARVSMLMRNLDESPLLEKPSLVEIKAATVGKRRLAEFTLNVSITRQTAEAGSKQAGSAGPAIVSTQTDKKP